MNHEVSSPLGIKHQKLGWCSKGSTNMHSWNKKKDDIRVHSTRNARGHPWTNGESPESKAAGPWRRTTPWPLSVRWWTWSMRLPRPWWPPWMDLPWVAGVTLGCWGRSWRSFQHPFQSKMDGFSGSEYVGLLCFTIAHYDVSWFTLIYIDFLISDKVRKTWVEGSHPEHWGAWMPVPRLVINVLFFFAYLCRHHKNERPAKVWDFQCAPQ